MEERKEQVVVRRKGVEDPTEAFRRSVCDLLSNRFERSLCYSNRSGEGDPRRDCDQELDQ